MFETQVTGAAPARRLTKFTAAGGEQREVLLSDGPAGRIVFDRAAREPRDMRLVAHLGLEEPLGNADLLAQLYAGDAAVRALRCVAPSKSRPLEAAAPPEGSCAQRELVGPGGAAISLRATVGGELRWIAADGKPLSVRDVAGALESYAPVRAATEAAIAAAPRSAGVLRSELRRLLESPILLNRALRERVERELAGRHATLGAMAMRCGRTKRDSSGGLSGDTSWLARRVGMLPEGGRRVPTPWVHTDVLALIARSALDVSPREVETP